VVQEVEHLPSKPEALTSNRSTIKKEEEGKKTENVVHNGVLLSLKEK
jgi:hypothetical protein